MNNLLKQIKKARFIFIAGNGGSAATAEHFANDLFKKGYKAICLNSNVSIITMIANDYGYEYIFSDQLRTYARREDLLITISCSGVSENIIHAHNMAATKRMKVYAFKTFSALDNDYGLLEDYHLQFTHEVTKAL